VSAYCSKNAAGKANLRKSARLVPARQQHISARTSHQAHILFGVRVSVSRNPTHGSGWIVQTQPTKTRALELP